LLCDIASSAARILFCTANRAELDLIIAACSLEITWEAKAAPSQRAPQ
jgi:hypothetical protein